MLCKLLTCPFDATERRITPYGTVNLCADHADEYDAVGGGRPAHVMGELMFACRYGPSADPPLSEPERGPGYVHGYKSGTE